MDRAVEYEAVIGLEVHAELETRSKMFCACPVVDVTQAEPNSAVCPVCAGMPGVLPVVNRRAVEYALRVALALECEIAPMSLFARKNYFYPDLPKGYQISQYDQPLARNGRLIISTPTGERAISIRRVHLEEDTGKLTHVHENGGSYSLLDLNRAGVPLLEIVSEPHLTSAEEVRAYAVALRSILRYVGANSGDMQKGVLRIEPNVSVRLRGDKELGVRTEIKNLNSFRALERAVAHEVARQIELLRRGEPVFQETRGWDEVREVTFTQRRKETEDDYRYFPEPDLPPLEISREWIEEVRRSLPELPYVKRQRFQREYALNTYEIDLLIEDRFVADFFEDVIRSAPQVSPHAVANWMIGEVFSLLNQTGVLLEESHLSPEGLAALLTMVQRQEINQSTAKNVLAEMFISGKSPEKIVSEQGLAQISDETVIQEWVEDVLQAYPREVAAYWEGKEGLRQWFFGQVMRAAQGKANPQVVHQVLQRQLEQRRKAKG